MEIPEYVDRAFTMVRYIDYEEDIKKFQQHWGGLDMKTLFRAFQEGQGEERILAIFALGYAEQAETRELLLPLVGSADDQERWASAMMLGEMREERVRPLLEEMLTEKLPVGDEPVWLPEDPYDFWRLKVADILGRWQNPVIVPALRRSFVRIWEEAQRKRVGDKQQWFRFQDELAQALGRYGAFGALTGLNLPEYGLRVAVVYLVCGYLNASETYGNLLLALQTNEALQQEVSAVLEQKFGLSESERDYYIKMYGDDYFARQWQLNR